jgi:hypothetical protein
LEEQNLICRVAANKLIRQSRTADKGWSSNLGLGEVLRLPLKTHVNKYSKGEMLPLETKQSGGKLLSHSDLGGEGGVSKGSITQQVTEKRPLGRPRHRWEDNIKLDLQEVGGVVETGWSWHRIGRGGGHL